jgi:hypothetical protein
MRFVIEVEPQLLSGGLEEQELELEHVLDLALRANGASPNNIEATVVNSRKVGVSLVDVERDVETVKDIINESLLTYFDDEVVCDSDIQVSIVY